MNKTYKIELIYNELLLLDGEVSESAQRVIDDAKKEQSFGFDLPLINEVIKKSEQIGTLSWTYKSIKHCPYCDKKYAYHKRKRATKYHRKGSEDYSKPIYYSGIAFNEGFVTIQGVGDMCTDCCSKYNVIETVVNYILDNDLKIEIKPRDYKDKTKYIKDDIRICFECKQEMQESKMGKLPAMMSGYYPGKCPNCGAESLPLFGPSHKHTDKFVMIEKPIEELKKSYMPPKQAVQKLPLNIDATDDEIEEYFEDEESE